MSTRKIILTFIILLSGIVCNAQSSSDSISVDTLLLDDGTLYIGHVRDSLFNGQGTCIYTDGTVYEGSWKDGLWDGQGTLRYPDGDIYLGHFKQHEKEGKGTYMYSDGAKYEGEWKEDKFNGKGRLVFTDGGVYDGEWKDDMKHGFGQLTTNDRQIYVGYFYNDEYLGMPFDVDIDADEPLTDDLVQWGFKHEPVYEVPQLSVAISYSLKGMATISFWMDYSNNYFWGLTAGRAVETPLQGKKSNMSWSAFPDDVYLESDFISSIYAVDLGVRIKKLSIGGSAGIGIIKSYKNCKANSGNDTGHKEYHLKVGEQYYKSLDTGAALYYRAFLRYSIQIKNRPKLFTYLGYGNSEGMFLGLGIPF